ncbi:MAG: permease-like cell division protein FtsX [Clostridiales bacterium]|nr:permease-like cell division protein FtsX [Clostridiales bacterium]
MRLSTIGYCLKQGFKNIWRNKLFSLASMATMAACIFMFGVFFCIVQNFQHFVKEAEEGVAVTVLFEAGTSEEEILEIGDQLTKRKEVAEVVYVSAEEAWKSYQEIYFKDSPELADAFVDDNPLANSANLEIYMKDISEQQNLVDYIESMEHVRKINRSDAVADILTGFNRLISYVSVAIIGLLLAVAVFLISNTIAIGISVRREEIGIMRLIGAVNSFIKAPFLIEGVVIGTVGAAIPLGFLYYLYNRMISYIAMKFAVLTGVMKFIEVNELFRVLLPVGLVLGVGIGFFGSFFTIQRHLKV